MGLALVTPAIPREQSREAELEVIRDQIMVLQSRLHRVRRDARGLRGELHETDVALELQQMRLEEAIAARRLAEESLAEVEAGIEELERRLEELRELLRRRLIDLHRLGQQGYLRLFLSIDSERDLLPGIRQLRFLVRRDGGLVESYLSTRSELDFELQEFQERNRSVRLWLQLESDRLAELQSLRRRQRSLLAELESQDRSLSVQTARLVDKERKLSNLLDFLYGRTSVSLEGTAVQEFRGALDWPAAGRVVQGFGPRLEPRYQTQVPHNGIELALASRKEVRSIYPGRVLFAAPFQGYGLTAVVHHPGRVFTLYAGLGRLLIGEGDMLSLGQVIGLSADTLYFEIREENRPVDPLDWLR